MKKTRKMLTVGFMAAILWSGNADAREVRLARKGKANCVIVVPPGSVTWEGSTGRLPRAALDRILEQQRRLQRDSVADLAHYLGKMSGVKIEIVEGLPAKEKRLPIYVGAEAQKVFGPVGISKARLFGFRVVVGRKGIGLYGESVYGTSYAIYELLHRLGCRWFMPTELGEVVPESPTLTVPVMDHSLAPATESRGMWQGGADFLRRNRMGRDTGVMWVHPGQGGLENYISGEQRKAHPEWCLHIHGKPHPRYLRWTREDVANAVADEIIKQIEADYLPALDAGVRVGFGLIPGDYVVPADDPEEAKADPEPRVWEPAAGRWSVTDRYILIANRVAERVGKEYPKVLFGVLAYVNMSLPPAKYPVHPNLEVTIAPIDFNRMHPMTWPKHPNEFWLRDMVKGWGKKASRLTAYWYGMNLAELSAPNPFITKWGTDIPLLLKNHMVNWQPETMGGWDSMLPGYALAARMTFYPEETPEQVLNDLWTKFYGAAAEPMSRYWHVMDRAWIDPGEYAGSFFGYLRMFTPEVLQAARKEIDSALRECRTVTEYRRVKLIDESFRLFELFMKMRRDWANGRLRSLASDYDIWRSGVRDMVRRYRDPADSTYVQGRYGTLIYPDAFLAGIYRDASRMDREHARHGAPMLEWKWKHNPGPEAESLPWTAPEYDEKDWPKTHVVSETWSTIGHHTTMTEASANRSGRMVYRASQKLRALPAGKKAFLWIGSTDGSAKVFVNGKHVKYTVPADTRRHKKGDQLEAFSGYCRSAQFDITAALKPGDNQFTILCERTWLNELGTGGLMGPVVLYRKK
jgi:hypothetical protein